MTFAFRIHAKDCVGCHACEVACKQQHELAPGVDLIRVLEKIPEFQPVYCRHCLRPPCLEACPTGAISKEMGTVLLDQQKCIGCRACMESCPFQAIGFDLEKGVAAKCDMCLRPRVLQGATPACVSVCPARCIQFGKAQELFGRPWP
ncbi:MAG: 4Fe-4S dicluster domain-containing protein [Thermodesulfobacteriota bacterium]